MTAGGGPEGHGPGPRAWVSSTGPRLTAALLAAAAIGLALGAGGVLLLANGNGGEPAQAEEQPMLFSVDELRQPIHVHADFAVFVRGRQVDFNKPEYAAAGEEETGANAHIHPPRSTVVHVHREQTTWAEFFNSLGISFTDSCLTLSANERYCSGDEDLVFVVNGVPVDSIRSLSIGDLDRLLISYGAGGPDRLAAEVAAVSDEACIPSGLCAARIDPSSPDKEPCGKTGGVCH